MSLINDALKKAQKQRTGEAPSLGSMPSVGGQSAASISRRSKPSGLNTLLLRGGIGAAVLLVLVVGGWFAFGGKAPNSMEHGARSTEIAKSVPATTPASSLPTPSSTPLPAVSRPPSPEAPAPALAAPQPTGAGGFTLQVAPKPEPVKATAQVQSTSPAPQRPDEPSVAMAKEGEPAKPAPKLEPRAMTFIDNLKVAGVRASATESKVLMNDRVYRLGDVVDHEMGLKLVGITSNSLTFEDEKGARYTRNL